MAITGQAFTLDAFLSLPEEKPALEYVAGAVRQKVSPEIMHSLLQKILCQWIDAFGLPSKLVVSAPELRTSFGGASHVPDVSVCRWGRIPRDSQGWPRGPLQEPPLVAIEIASPGQSRKQLREDCEWYVANGVALAPLLDPEHQAILVYRPGMAAERLQGADVLDFGDVLPGFQFVVGDLYAAVRLD